MTNVRCEYCGETSSPDESRVHVYPHKRSPTGGPRIVDFGKVRRGETIQGMLCACGLSVNYVVLSRKVAMHLPVDYTKLKEISMQFKIPTGKKALNDVDRALVAAWMAGRDAAQAEITRRLGEFLFGREKQYVEHPEE